MSAADLAKTPNQALAETIDAAFERREEIGPAAKGAVREAVDEALDLLDRGAARVAQKAPDGSWRVNQWLKKAVLLSFRMNDMAIISGGPGRAVWLDKVPSDFEYWDNANFRRPAFAPFPVLLCALCFYRARCGADAVLRQSRRLCRQRHHD